MSRTVYILNIPDKLDMCPELASKIDSFMDIKDDERVACTRNYGPNGLKVVIVKRSWLERFKLFLGLEYGPMKEVSTIDFGEIQASRHGGD